MRAVSLFICTTGGFVAAADLLVLVKGTQYGVNLNDGQVRASIKVTGENNEVSFSIELTEITDTNLKKDCHGVSLPFGQHKTDTNKFAAVIPFMAPVNQPTCLNEIQQLYSFAIEDDELLVYDATDNSFSFKLVLDLKLRFYEGDVLPVDSAEDDDDDIKHTLAEKLEPYTPLLLPSDWLQKLSVPDLQTFTLSLLQTLMSQTGKQCVVKSDLAQSVMDLPQTQRQVQTPAPPQQGSTGRVEVLDPVMIAEKVAAILALQAANDAPWGL